MRVPLVILGILLSIGLALGGCADGRRGGANEHEPQVISAQLARSGEVNLLAMGDWGNGRRQQQRVAHTLAQYVRDSGKRFDGILLAGDNFYVQLSGVRDRQWDTLFEDLYDPDVLDFPFYAVLGNHDYEHGKDVTQLAYARANPQSRWTMPSRWYRIDFPQDQPLVTVFMLDSNRRSLRSALWNAQNQWLRDQLADPQALGSFVFACAHHPLFSNGSHGDAEAMQREWGPLFQEYGVDLYLCGHDHDLQHLEIPGLRTSFVLAGGGGAGIRPMRRDDRGPFSRSLHGFVHLNITPRRTTVTYVDVHGNVVHKFQRDRDGSVRVLDTTGRDQAQPRAANPPATQPTATTAPAE